MRAVELDPAEHCLPEVTEDRLPMHNVSFWLSGSRILNLNFPALKVMALAIRGKATA
jgi:hypothetical protein